ncbi:MAG TPA: peptidylprolyl isomerase [Candidatus Binatia bacterium]|nr:peptidylprolyl isomerase [Candidatus Binatia bacterium]
MLTILIVAVFFVHCDNSSAEKQAKKAADLATAVENQAVLVIGSISRTNRDLKSFFKLHYADIIAQKDNDKMLSRLFDVFCEQQILLFKAQQDNIQVSDLEVDDYLKGIQARRRDLVVDRAETLNVLKIQKYLLGNVYKDIAVSDAEVTQFYESHLDDFRRSEEIELFQIMAKEREKLLEIRQQLLGQPARFEEIARRDSISPEAANGGAMGFFEKGMLPQEMEGVVFSLKVNEISPLVESPYGFHLFKVTQKRKARMLALAAVKDEIRNKMLSARLAAAYQDFLTALKAAVPLQVNHGNLYFPYIKSDSGVNENETKNLSGGDPDPAL